MQQSISHAHSRAWLTCPTPRFCASASDAAREPYNPRRPIIVHLEVLESDSDKVVPWLQAFGANNRPPLVLVVRDGTSPLSYYTWQELLGITVVMQDSDMRIPERWQLLCRVLDKMGPLQHAVTWLQQAALPKLVEEPKLLLQLIQMAPDSDQISQLEAQMQRRRGDLSRRFKEARLQQPMVILSAVRTALCSELMDCGMTLEEACQLISTNERSLRDKHKRTYGMPLATVLQLSPGAVQGWCVDLMRSDQEVLSHAEAYEQLVARAHFVRRIA